MSPGWPTAYDDTKGVRSLRPHCRVTSTTRPDDPVWDGFLEGTNLGQFQQTSGWAIVKAADGWKLARSVVARSGAIIGGVQLLWKQKGPFRIGYATKGPVVVSSDIDDLELVLDGLFALTRQLRLSALIVQPPDLQTNLPSFLQQRGLQHERFMGVIGSTLLVDLSDGLAAVEAGMRRRTLQEIRQAKRRGVVVREGERKDLPAFFSLMKQTCERQGGLPPNPSSEAGLGVLWDAFCLPPRCRLTLAESQGKPIAGLLCVAFGQRLTLWKKGSEAGSNGLHPMALLYQESLAWGGNNGFREADFGSIRSDIATAIELNQPLSEAQRQTRDFYNLGFGGRPLRLPQAMIHFPNPLFRLGYAGITKFPWLRRAAKRMAG
jgi:hypothetical protein